MIHKVQLIDLGDEGAFLPLPKEVVARMNGKVGDELIATKTQDGFTLTSSSATCEG